MSHNFTLTKENISNLSECDIILGCTDNLKSRFLINEFSLKKNIPWVHGGATKTNGNLLNIIPGNVCFRCVFQPSKNKLEGQGILNTLPTIIGAMQVTEAIKIILKKKYEKKLIYFNIWKNKFNKITVEKNSKCPACKGNYEFIN